MIYTIAPGLTKNNKQTTTKIESCYTTSPVKPISYYIGGTKTVKKTTKTVLR